MEIVRSDQENGA